MDIDKYYSSKGNTKILNVLRRITHLALRTGRK